MTGSVAEPPTRSRSSGRRLAYLLNVAASQPCGFQHVGEIIVEGSPAAGITTPVIRAAKRQIADYEPAAAANSIEDARFGSWMVGGYRGSRNRLRGIRCGRSIARYSMGAMAKSRRPERRRCGRLGFRILGAAVDRGRCGCEHSCRNSGRSIHFRENHSSQVSSDRRARETR